MATLTSYAGTDTLKTAWPIWKQNTINVNTQLVNHVAGTADKHTAISDSNTSTGVTNIKFYTCTAAEYAAIVSKDAATIYFVV